MTLLTKIGILKCWVYIKYKNLMYEYILIYCYTLGIFFFKGKL